MNAVNCRQQKFAILLPFVALIAALLTAAFALFSQPWFLRYFQAHEADPILVELKTGYYSNTCVFYAMYCMSLIYVGIYMSVILFIKFRDRRRMSVPASMDMPYEERKLFYLSRRRQAKQNNQFWVAGHVFFVLLLMGLIFLNKAMLESNAVGIGEDTRLARDAFRADIANYRNGNVLTYRGPLIFEKYVPSDHGNMQTGKPYYYFTGDISKSFRLRCPVENFNGKQLLMPVYDVKYLPRTAYALSVVGPDGRERLGQVPQRSPEEDQWTYGDLLLKRSFDVPGYSDLNEGQQKLFDLLNSNVLLENMLQLDHDIYYVELEDVLTKAECDKVDRLYERTNGRYTQNDPLFDFLFIPDEDGIVQRLQISGKDYSPRIRRLYGAIFRQRALEAVQSLPKASDPREQSMGIVDYLLENVSPVEKLDENERKRFTSASTGFGALVEGAATAKGYALAFDAMARYAGLKTQYIAEDGNYKRTSRDDSVDYWNAVRLENGRWLEINVHAMALEKYADKSGMQPFGGKFKGWVATWLAGNSKFGYVQVPAGWGAEAAEGDRELLCRRKGGKSWIKFQMLETPADQETFDPVAAAKEIRAEIEANGGVVYTDYTEYLTQDCHSHLLCAALPDGMFLIVWTYPQAQGQGCSLSVYGDSETTAALDKLVQRTFSMTAPE